MIRRNIILIGMPGSGKSTIGRRVAKKLEMEFLDTDHILLANTDCKTLGEVKQKLGAKGYREAEEAAICSVRVRGHIIATGGSAVLSVRAMHHLQRLGTIVFLYVPCFILQRRVGDLESRGVIMGKNEDFSALFEERYPLYRRYGEITFRPIRINPGKSAELLAGLLRLLYEDSLFPVFPVLDGNRYPAEFATRTICSPSEDSNQSKRRGQGRRERNSDSSRQRRRRKRKPRSHGPRKKPE